jgi:hypothetical protein
MVDSVEGVVGLACGRSKFTCGRGHVYWLHSINKGSFGAVSVEAGRVG